MTRRPHRPFRIGRPRGFPRPVDRRHAAELGELARRIQEERRAAAPIVALIRRMAAANITILFPAEWITPGVAEGLTNESASAAAASPALALTLANHALTVAMRLDATDPADCRSSSVAHAWGHIAAASTAAADPDGALNALARADAALGGKAWLARDQAILDTIRATVLHALGRIEESRTLLDVASRAFASFGDTRRAPECERLKTSLDARGDA